MRIQWPCFAMLAAVLLVGCGTIAPAEIVEKPVYEQQDYHGMIIEGVTVVPEIQLRLTQSEVKTSNYSISRSDLICKKVNVSVGSKVQEGDVLVEFDCEELTQKLNDLEQQYQDNQLLKEHYERLSSIDSKTNYQSQINKLTRDNEVLALYIEETKDTMDSYIIRAESAGTVTYIMDNLAYGYYVADNCLVRVISSNGNYQATTKDSYEFKVGDLYRTDNDFEFEVMDVTKMESRGSIEQTIQFRPLSDLSAISEGEEMTLTIQKPKQTDAIVLNDSMINRTSKWTYVYVLEDGILTTREISIGDAVGDGFIITEGLSIGEEVLASAWK